MHLDLLLIVVFILVFFGLWGFAGAQIRAYQCLHMLRQAYPIWVKIAVSILTLLYVGFWASTYFHIVFRCFMGERCHATQNGELIYLAMFGFGVVCYESIFGLLRRYLKRKGDAAKSMLDMHILNKKP